MTNPENPNVDTNVQTPDAPAGSSQEQQTSQPVPMNVDNDNLPVDPPADPPAIPRVQLTAEQIVAEILRLNQLIGDQQAQIARMELNAAAPPPPPPPQPQPRPRETTARRTVVQHAPAPAP
ncbi:hypothetical protein BGX34_007995, partial [Mortierella sp. NVP85]